MLDFIGAAFEVALEAKTIILGLDVRASSEELAKSVAQGLIDHGCEVLDLGLSGTEEMYNANTHFGTGRKGTRIDPNPTMRDWLVLYIQILAVTFSQAHALVPKTLRR